MSFCLFYDRFLTFKNYLKINLDIQEQSMQRIVIEYLLSEFVYWCLFLWQKPPISTRSLWQLNGQAVLKPHYKLLYTLYLIHILPIDCDKRIVCNQQTNNKCTGNLIKFYSFLQPTIYHIWRPFQLDFRYFRNKET